MQSLQFIGSILPYISRGLRIDPIAEGRINPIQPKIIQSDPILNSCPEQGLNSVPSGSKPNATH
jgi:hypothetical protein